MKHDTSLAMTHQNAAIKRRSEVEVKAFISPQRTRFFCMSVERFVPAARFSVNLIVSKGKGALPTNLGSFPLHDWIGVEQWQ